MPESTSFFPTATSPSGNYEWVNVYTRVADKLLEFRHNRPALIAHIKNAYAAAEMKLPTLDREGREPADICPFTAIGLFNKQMTELNRKKLLKSLLSELGLALKCPASFDGVPVLNPQKSTFYWFGNNQAHDISTLWEMFDAAIALLTLLQKRLEIASFSCMTSARPKRALNGI